MSAIEYGLSYLELHVWSAEKREMASSAVAIPRNANVLP
jgi:hypothetical protein